jgi:hypothetical protein
MIIKKKKDTVRIVFFLKEMRFSGKGMEMPILAGCGFCMTEIFSWLKNTTTQIQQRQIIRF